MCCSRASRVLFLNWAFTFLNLVTLLNQKGYFYFKQQISQHSPDGNNKNVTFNLLCLLILSEYISLLQNSLTWFLPPQILKVTMATICGWKKHVPAKPFFKNVVYFLLSLILFCFFHVDLWTVRWREILDLKKEGEVQRRTSQCLSSLCWSKETTAEAYYG